MIELDQSKHSLDDIFEREKASYVQKVLVKEFTEVNEIVKSNIILIERFEHRIKDRIAKVWEE